MIDWIKQRGRPFLFSNALSPSEVAACLRAVELLKNSDELVKRLWDNSKYFKAKMKKLGFDIGNSQTPITPVMLGEASIAHGMSKRLFEENVFAQALGYPTVPKGKARIRVMVSAGHSKEDLDYGIGLFASIGREFGIIK